MRGLHSLSDKANGVFASGVRVVRTGKDGGLG